MKIWFFLCSAPPAVTEMNVALRNKMYSCTECKVLYFCFILVILSALWVEISWKVLKIFTCDNKQRPLVDLRVAIDYFRQSIIVACLVLYNFCVHGTSLSEISNSDWPKFWTSIPIFANFCHVLQYYVRTGRDIKNPNTTDLINTITRRLPFVSRF